MKLLVTLLFLFACGFSSMGFADEGTPLSTTEAPAVTAPKEMPKMSDEEIKEKGKQLRAAIDQRYDELEKANKIGGETDITPVVVKYVPVGISFDNAEAILRAAAFKVDPRIGADWRDRDGNKPWTYDVLASIRSYKSHFLASTGVYVSLSPRVPGDFSTVVKVSAGFVVSSL